MAEVSKTAGSVIYVSGGSIIDGTCGEAVVQGDMLYQHTDNTWKLAANDTALKAAVKGMALTGGSTGQPIKVLRPGGLSDPAIITYGGTLSLGKPYMLGSTGGAIMPADDVTNTVYSTYVGSAQTTANLIFQPVATGVIAAAAIT